MLIAGAALAALAFTWHQSRRQAAAEAALELQAAIAVLPVGDDAAERAHSAQELQRIAAEVDTRLAGNSALEAGLHLSLGEAFQALALPADAEPHLRAALEARRTALGAEHRDSLAAACKLAAGLQRLGRFDEAASLFRETLAVQIRTLGHNDADTLATAAAFADLLEGLGQPADAARLRQAAVQLRPPAQPAQEEPAR